MKRRNGVKLSAEQAAALTAMAKQFDGYRDSVYKDLSSYLGSLKGDYQTVSARRRWHNAFVAIAHVYVIAGPRVRDLLSEEQFSSLPVRMTAYFDMVEAINRWNVASSWNTSKHASCEPFRSAAT